MKNIAINVKNLVKKYKTATVPAVNDVSFRVEEGEFFAFLGPNGAGKTTTISILTTTLSKTSGEVSIAGFDLDQDEKKIRQNIGIIFQNPSLDLNLSAEMNIRMHAVMWGIWSFAPTYSLMHEDYKIKVNELAERLGIKDELFKPLKTFSGGMKRKLEIVRSLMHSPKILFLDEPTTGLDPLSRKNLWEYLNDMRSTQGMTIFLTTHYLDEAENVDRLAILDDGLVKFDGTPEKLKKKLVNYNMMFSVKKADEKSLESSLKKLEIEFSKDDLYRISLKNSENAREILTKISTPIDNLVISRPSLEDAYLQLIQD